MLLEQLAGTRRAVAEREQEQFAGDELVTALERFLFGCLQQPAQVGADLHLVLDLHLGQVVDGFLRRGLQRAHIGAGTLQQRARAVVLLQQGQQQVQGVDIGMVVAQRKRLGFRQGFLEFCRQFVNTHG